MLHLLVALVVIAVPLFLLWAVYRLVTKPAKGKQ